MLRPRQPQLSEPVLRGPDLRRDFAPRRWKSIVGQWSDLVPRAPLHFPLSLTRLSVHGGPKGYPELATFLDSDDNFMVYRRFGYLQARLLLEKQERLRVLEEELDALDKQQTADEEDKAALCTIDIDPAFKAERDALMAKVERAFKEYGKLWPKVSPYQSLTATSRPSPKGSVHDCVGPAHFQRI